MNKLTLTEESKAMLQEHAEFTKKWIEGLRSGKYTQIQEQMVDPNIPNSCCCLMVAEIVNGRKWEDHTYEINTNIGLEQVPAALPYDLGSEIQWTEKLEATYIEEGELYNKKIAPAGWNDDEELSFNQIADLLEFGEVEYD